MRVDRIPKDVITDIYKKVKEALRPNSSKIALDRLLASKCYGGYGLFNLEEMNKRLLRSWIIYLKYCRQDPFYKLMNWWNWCIQVVMKKQVGPILKCEGKSINYLVSNKALRLQKKLPNFPKVFWDFLLEAWEGMEVKIIVNKIINMKDQIKYLRERVNIYVDGDKFLFERSLKNEIKKVFIPRQTPAQLRWREEGKVPKGIFRFLKEASVPENIKYWNWDLLNVALATRYKKDKCCICEKRIGSLHFISECGGQDWVRKRFVKKTEECVGFQYVFLVRYITWRLHCAMKHEYDKSRWLGILRRIEYHWLSKTKCKLSLKNLEINFEEVILY